MASFLNIDPSKIKIAKVTPGSVIIDFFIIPFEQPDTPASTPDPVTITTQEQSELPPPDAAPDQVPQQSEEEQESQQSVMDTIANTISQGAKSGALSSSLGVSVSGVTASASKPKPSGYVSPYVVDEDQTMIII